MITQKEFEEKVEKFNTLKDFRDEVYHWTFELIEKKLELEGLCLMLFSWNFANMRRMLKTFSIKKFKIVIEEINPIFDKLKNERFETAEIEKIKGDISLIYNKLIPLVQYTGATKLMYFKNPKLFVMWDTGIRKFWGVKKVDADAYISFLKKMQKEFSHIKWSNEKMSLARAIDAYNFTITQENRKA